MLVKFLARGTGSARDAAKYLLGELDAAGKPREGVEVLRGDPNDVAALADTLEFEHRYTSGVIAWAPDDHPTDEQIERVLDEFEKTAWAGLEPDRYAWAAVLHRERGGGAHVHVLAARCDLETGRSLNIARRAGRRPSVPFGTPSTTNTAGLARTIRHGPGCSSPDTAPTSRRRGCGRGAGSKPPPAT